MQLAGLLCNNYFCFWVKQYDESKRSTCLRIKKFYKPKGVFGLKPFSTGFFSYSTDVRHLNESVSYSSVAPITADMVFSPYFWCDNIENDTIKSQNVIDYYLIQVEKHLQSNRKCFQTIPDFHRQHMRKLDFCQQHSLSSHFE